MVGTLRRYQMFIDSRLVAPDTGLAIVSVDPSNEEPWIEFPDASEKDVDRAVRAAHRAFEEGPWKRMPPAERRKRIRKFADQLANGTRYSFPGVVFTRDIGRAVRLARAVRAGRIWANSYRTTSMYVPFGGFNESGYGRESGLEALRDYTDTKGVFIDVSGKAPSDPLVMR